MIVRSSAPFGVPDDQPGADLVVELEQVQLPAEMAVVPLLRLFQDPQMLIERLLRREAGPVDALEHLVALVAAPVGAGHVEELEGPDHPRRGDMRPAAQIDVAALDIEADRLDVRRQIVDQLDLVVFPLLLKELDRLFAAHLAAFERKIRRGDLPHPRFDLFEILRA